jgi:acyl-CoA thioesterase
MDAQEIARRSAEAMYERDRASQKLGIEITEVAPGTAVATMKITADMVNGHDIAHGGYTFLLADTAFAFACNTYNEVTVAAGAEISFLDAVRLGDKLVATGTERHRSGRSGIYDVTVRDQDGTTVAEFRGRSRSLGQPLFQ